MEPLPLTWPSSSHWYRILLAIWIFGACALGLFLQSPSFRVSIVGDVSSSPSSEHSSWTTTTTTTTTTGMMHTLAQDDGPMKRSPNATHLSNMVVQSVLANQRKIQVGPNTSRTYYALVPPCKIVQTKKLDEDEDVVMVVESVSQLFVATAISKADNETRKIFDVWQFLDTLWGATPKDHDDSSTKPFFLPKFIYPVNKSTNFWSSASTGNGSPKGQRRVAPRYIPETRLPNWSLFYPPMNRSVTPLDHYDTVRRFFCHDNSTSVCWMGSGRISALPIHATFLLKIVSQLEQHEDPVQERDISRVQRYFERIYLYHEFLHDVVMRGCDSSPNFDASRANIDANGNENDTTVPCYNIVHPWESLMDQNSPTWKVALQSTWDRILALNWSLSEPVPQSVVESYDFDAAIYSAMIFLTECLANQTTIQSRTSNAYFPHDQFDRDVLRGVEDRILQQCSFAMLDAGYASALAQADADLIQLAVWLSAHSDHLSSAWSWNSRMVHLSAWKQQSENVIEQLWSVHAQSFLSKYATPKVSSAFLPGRYSYPTMEFCKVPVANNFMIFWQKEWQDGKSLQQPRLEKMVLQLLRHSGSFSFDCGPFPLWSKGCGFKEQQPGSPLIDPKLNYFVGTGLMHKQSNVAAFGEYMRDSSIQLICGSRQPDNTSLSVEHFNDFCANNATWLQEAYEVNPSAPAFHLDSCGSFSTATGGVLFHLLVSDHDFAPPVPFPPIRNSWVITLISMELMVAFSVGVACVGLSLGLVRRENSRSRTANSPDSSDLQTAFFPSIAAGNYQSDLQNEERY
jgi:hypothetical protein